MDLRLKRAKVKNKITFVSGNVGDEKVSTSAAGNLFF